MTSKLSQRTFIKVSLEKNSTRGTTFWEYDFPKMASAPDDHKITGKHPRSKVPHIRKAFTPEVQRFVPFALRMVFPVGAMLNLKISVNLPFLKNRSDQVYVDCHMEFINRCISKSSILANFLEHIDVIFLWIDVSEPPIKVKPPIRATAVVLSFALKVTICCNENTMGIS